MDELRGMRVASLKLRAATGTKQERERERRVGERPARAASHESRARDTAPRAAAEWRTGSGLERPRQLRTMMALGPGRARGLLELLGRPRGQLVITCRATTIVAALWAEGGAFIRTALDRASGSPPRQDIRSDVSHERLTAPGIVRRCAELVEIGRARGSREGAEAASEGSKHGQVERERRQLF